MRNKTLKEIISAILAIPVAVGVLTAALAQTNVLPIGPEEIEVQVRQHWKDSEATCENSNQSKIDRIDILNNYEFKNWLLTRHSIYGYTAKVFPEGNYVRVASSMERIGDGIAVFGPVYNAVKSADFHNLIGLPICNYRLVKN